MKKTSKNTKGRGEPIAPKERREGGEEGHILLFF